MLFRILKDQKKNAQLLEDGFIKMKIFNEDDLISIKRYFSFQHDKIPIKGFFVSASFFDEHKSNEISLFIADTIKSHLNPLLDEAEILGGTFIVKSAFTTEKLQPHQDWSIVDESSGRSYTLWVALEDTNDDNGSIYFLPKSHNQFRGYRHISIPSIFGKVYESVWKYMVPMHLKAGEGVLFDHAIGHASMPNNSDKDRVILTCSVLSNNAKFRFYFQENGKITEYVGEANYYQKEKAKFGPGKLEKIRVLKDISVQLSKTQLVLNFSLVGRIWNGLIKNK